MFHAKIPVQRYELATRPLKIMLLAKHAKSDGKPDEIDGNHALYHYELRTTLQSLGYDVVPENRFEALFERPDVDFVIPLTNRVGFTHSEMLAPLLLTRLGIPFLGAPPIIRGLTDNKHLTKIVARSAGVPTADWKLFPHSSADTLRPDFADRAVIVKPNASSASWGIGKFDNWRAAIDHVRWLHDQRHDALVEEWMPLIDIAVPVIGDANGDPWLLPPMAYQPEDPLKLRSYEEKRGLVATEEFDPLEPVVDEELVDELQRLVAPLVKEFWPFDYGRFEFRYDPENRRLSFMEVNLSCNLWSRKTISRSARTLGIDHEELVGKIISHSLGRQRLIPSCRQVPVY